MQEVKFLQSLSHTKQRPYYSEALKHSNEERALPITVAYSGTGQQDFIGNHEKTHLWETGSDYP